MTFKSTARRYQLGWIRIVAIGLLISSCTYETPDYVDVSTLETTYAFLATVLREPRVCEKISPKSVGEIQYTADYGVGWWRSICYEYVAHASGDADNCDRVEQFKRGFGSKFEQSVSSCHASFAAKRQTDWDQWPLMYRETVEWPLRFMGYELPVRQDRDYTEFFHAKLATGELHERLQRLPDLSAPVTRSSIPQDCTPDERGFWFCYARHCVSLGDFRRRNECLAIANYLRRLEEQLLEGKLSHFPRWVNEPLGLHPELRYGGLEPRR